MSVAVRRRRVELRLRRWRELELVVGLVELVEQHCARRRRVRRGLLLEQTSRLAKDAAGVAFSVGHLFVHQFTALTTATPPGTTVHVTGASMRMPIRRCCHRP